MIAWLAGKLGLSQILIEVILAALLAGGCWIALQRWGAKQWAKGEQQGRDNVAADISKKKEAEWAAKEKTLAVEAATLAADRRTIDVQASEIAATRAATRAALTQIIDAARKTQGESNAKVLTVPGPELDDALRTISAQLAAAH